MLCHALTFIWQLYNCYNLSVAVKISADQRWCPKQGHELQKLGVKVCRTVRRVSGRKPRQIYISRPHLAISRLYVSSSHQGAELRLMTVNSDQLLTSLIGRWVAELPVRLNHCLVNFKVFCNVTGWQYWLGNGNFNEYFYRLKSPKRAFVLSLVND